MAAPDDAGRRLDQFLASRLDAVSRARVQQLIAGHQVLVNEAPAKASLRLHGNEQVCVLGTVQRPPLRAMAEEIPLDVVDEDDDLAVINKPAGMMVHAGAGATEDDRNRGTLVNALLYRFGKLSGAGGELRPGIVHRLDKATSGLIVVAEKRSGSPSVGRSVCPAASQENLRRVSAWLDQARSGNYRQQHQPRPDTAYSHDYAAGGRQRSDYPLHGATKAGYPCGKVFIAGIADRHRTDSSNSRAPGFAGASYYGRRALRSATDPASHR